MGFFKKILGIAAPIIGSVFGGPIGGMIGGAIGGAASGGGLKGALTGALGSYLGTTVIPGLFQSAGNAIGGFAGMGAAGVPPNPWAGSTSLFASAGEGFTPNYDLFSGSGGGAGGMGLNPGASGITGLSPTIAATGPSLVGEAARTGLQAGPSALGTIFNPANASMGTGSMLPPGLFEGGGGGFGGAAGGEGASVGGPVSAATNPVIEMFRQAGTAFGPGNSRLGNIIQVAAGGNAILQSLRMQKLMEQQMGGLPNPGDVTKLPGYEAGIEAVRRSLASQGFQGSGNMMAALHKYGGDFYNDAVRQHLANRQLNASTANAVSGPIMGQTTGLALLSQGLR